MSFYDPKSEQEVIDYVKRRLGGDKVKLELSDEQLSDAVADTKRWFLSNWGIVRAKLFVYPGNQTELTLEEDVARIVDVYEEKARFPALGLDIREIPFLFQQGFRAGLGFVFSYPQGLYSALVQQLQWIEQLKRVFSAELTWEYNPISRVLRVFPLRTADRRVLIEYMTTVMDIRELFGEALDVFLKYCVAVTKERLGYARRKFDSIPYATGTVSLDGAALVDEGKTEQRELTEWALNRVKPAVILRG